MKMRPLRARGDFFFPAEPPWMDEFDFLIIEFDLLTLFLPPGGEDSLQQRMIFWKR